MKIKKVINFDDFLYMAQDVLSVTWNEQYLYYNCIFKAMVNINHKGQELTDTKPTAIMKPYETHKPGIGVIYFEFLIIIQYIFNNKIPINKLEKIFMQNKNNDGVIDYRLFEKIIVENELFDIYFFKNDFIKIDVADMHTILIDLSDDLNNSSTISIIDNIESRINTLLKNNNNKDIGMQSIYEQLFNLVELTEQCKKKIMNYKHKDSTGIILFNC